MPLSLKEEARYIQLWIAMRQAAQSAAEAENEKLGDENSRGLDCGFAWVHFPGNTGFARWAKKTGHASKHHPSDLSVWYYKQRLAFAVGQRS